MVCSIQKLLHPNFLRYYPYLKYRFSNMEELITFLKMVKLKEGKLKHAFKQKEEGVKNKYLANMIGVEIRRFQQLYAAYKMTGDMPKLKKERRPKSELTEEDKLLIGKALRESRLNGAVKIRLYIDKYYHKKLPYGKIHKYLLSSGISKLDKKKQKQRKYCKYQREHSFSLGHMDWHESKVIEGKWVCAWEDDASRKILAGGEFSNATTENSKKIVREVKKIAFAEYSATPRELNTDKGSQFYANKKNDKDEKSISEFEKFLEKEGIKHIPSRRNHPQTNGKEERWFRTYNEKRHEFKRFRQFMDWYNNTIHLGLNRKEGVTPNEAIVNKLPPESLLGLFLKWVDKK